MSESDVSSSASKSGAVGKPPDPCWQCFEMWAQCSWRAHCTRQQHRKCRGCSQVIKSCKVKAGLDSHVQSRQHWRMSLADKIALGSHSVNNMFIEGLICTVYMTCSLQCHVHNVWSQSYSKRNNFFQDHTLQLAHLVRTGRKSTLRFLWSEMPQEINNH